MFRFIVYLFLVGVLAGCNARTFPSSIPTYSGKVDVIDEPVVVTVKAFPETPVEFYSSSRSAYMYRPDYHSRMGTLEAKQKHKGVSLIADVPLTEESKRSRRFQFELNEFGLVTNGLENTSILLDYPALGSLVAPRYFLPILEAGFVSGEMYGIPRQASEELSQGGYLFRGKTTFKGRPALLFEFRGLYETQGYNDLAIGGYRLVDIETGAVLFSEFLNVYSKYSVDHVIVEMDVSKWAAEDDKSI